MQNYIHEENLAPKEQKVLQRIKKIQGTNINIKNSITKTKSKKKAYCLTWIDYQKSFDIIMPRSWILKFLKLTGISKKKNPSL